MYALRLCSILCAWSMSASAYSWLVRGRPKPFSLVLYSSKFLYLQFLPIWKARRAFYALCPAEYVRAVPRHAQAIMRVWSYSRLPCVGTSVVFLSFWWSKVLVTVVLAHVSTGVRFVTCWRSKRLTSDLFMLAAHHPPRLRVAQKPQ